MMLVSMLLLAAQAAVSPPVTTVPPSPPPGAAAAQQAVTAPVPRGTLISLFSPDDYPAALGDRAGRRGAVSLKLTADPSGRLAACMIARSSGEQVLDMWTCNTLRRRARFTPAMDANGTPTSGTLDVTVDWDAIFERSRLR